MRPEDLARRPAPRRSDRRGDLVRPFGDRGRAATPSRARLTLRSYWARTRFGLARRVRTWSDHLCCPAQTGRNSEGRLGTTPIVIVWWLIRELWSDHKGRPG